MMLERQRVEGSRFPTFASPILLGYVQINFHGQNIKGFKKALKSQKYFQYSTTSRQGLICVKIVDIHDYKN